MNKSLRCNGLLWMVCLVLALSSCIDHDYDLNDVDTDEITIGDEVIGPLGKVVVSAAKIIDYDPEDTDAFIKRNEATKDYYVSYSGNYSILPSSIPGIENKTYQLRSASINGLTEGEIPVSGSVPVTGSTTNIPLETTEDITRIDRIVFNRTQDSSILSFSYGLKNLRFSNGAASVSLEVSLPEGYKIAQNSLPANVKMENGLLVVNDELNNYHTGAAIELELEEIVPSQGPEGDLIEVSIDLVFQENTHVVVGPSPGFDLSAELKNLDYQVIYGEFDSDFHVDITPIDMSELNDIFEGDGNVLSFVSPYIKFNTASNIGIPMVAELGLVSESADDSSSTDVDGIMIAAAPYYGEIGYSHTWIGNDATSMEPGYTFIANDGLNDLIRISPDILRIDADIRTLKAAQTFFPGKAEAQMDYEVVIPLAPAHDFQAYFEELVEDMFDDDIKEYLFSSGTMKLHGTATNSLPLALDVEMIVVDAAGNDVGVVLEPQRVASCTSAGAPVDTDVSFFFTENDMDKIANASDLILRFTGYGNSQTEGIALNDSQELLIDLKFDKKGGITIK